MDGGVASIYVDILTPALSYPATLSRTEIISNCQRDLCLSSEECLFFNIDNDRIGCLLKNNRFTMEYVERQYHQSVHLAEQLERAAEALKVFQDRMVQDQDIISNLRSQLDELKGATPVEDSTLTAPPPGDFTDWKIKYEEEVATRRNLQEKLQKLKQLLQYNSSSSEDLEGETESVKPRVVVPKLALKGAVSPTVGPRSKSSSDIINNFEEKMAVPQNTTAPSQSEQDYSGQDGPNSLKRRNTIANLKPIDPTLDLSIPQDALSQCRLCNCDVFRATQKAGWICLCGHTSIKHSNIAYKISPRSMSPRSPRSFSGV